jgi:hypothetical protein
MPLAIRPLAIPHVRQPMPAIENPPIRIRQMRGKFFARNQRRGSHGLPFGSSGKLKFNHNGRGGHNEKQILIDSSHEFSLRPSRPLRLIPHSRLECRIGYQTTKARKAR